MWGYHRNLVTAFSNNKYSFIMIVGLGISSIIIESYNTQPNFTS